MTRRDPISRRIHEMSDDELAATYSAARGFLVAEWFGALLMVASYTILYLLLLSQGVAGWRLLALSGILLALGTTIFWRSRAVYLDLDFPWKRKWELAAAIFAGSAAVFWLLFLILAAMVWNGIPILPD